jgi:hypothetical protein
MWEDQLGLAMPDLASKNIEMILRISQGIHRILTRREHKKKCLVRFEFQINHEKSFSVSHIWDILIL